MSIDPTGKAFQLMIELTNADIPEAELVFSTGGMITKK